MKDTTTVKRNFWADTVTFDLSSEEVLVVLTELLQQAVETMVNTENQDMSALVPAEKRYIKEFRGKMEQDAKQLNLVVSLNHPELGKGVNTNWVKENE